MLINTMVFVLHIICFQGLYLPVPTIISKFQFQNAHLPYCEKGHKVPDTGYMVDLYIKESCFRYCNRYGTNVKIHWLIEYSPRGALGSPAHFRDAYNFFFLTVNSIAAVVVYYQMCT